MNKLKKNTSLKFLMLCILILSLILSIFMSLNFSQVHAQEMTDYDLQLKCKKMTESDTFNVNNVEKSLHDYPSYLNERFQLTNSKFGELNIKDEWILNIVPVELFKQKEEDYFYIGDTYGFYFDYDVSNDTYLIYFVQHINEFEFGNLTQTIKPLYYEQYVFDESNEQVSLVYMDYHLLKEYPEGSFVKEHFYHYEKYSRYEKLYLKDVNFSSTLYNENHLNVGEYGYNAYNDNGGYFIGNQYYFNGVSTQSGKTDFALEVFKMGIGYIPLGKVFSVGDAINVDTFATELVDFIDDAKDDFRSTVSNNDVSKYVDIKDIHHEAQIADGGLYKNAGTLFETDNSENAVLYGINSDNKVTNISTINHINNNDRWNTRFVGKIKLDIVREIPNSFGSTVEDIATVESNDWHNSFDLGYKTEVELDEENELYILGDAKHKTSFVAPENGLYTIKTYGDVKNSIESSAGVVTEIDAKNEKLVVDLNKGDMFSVDIVKDDFYDRNFVGIKVEFTPVEIVLGGEEYLTILPGEKEFFLFNPEENMKAFSFDISSEHNISLDIFESNLFFLKYNLSGTNIHGSLFNDDYRYLIGIVNNSDESISVSVNVEEILTVQLSASHNLKVLDRKIVALTSQFNTVISINANSPASIYLKLYDENKILVAQSVTDSVIKYEVEKNKNYYLLIENYDYIDSDAELLIYLDSYRLNMGNNTLKDVKIDDLYVFQSYDLIAHYNIVANSAVEIYNKNFDKMLPDLNNVYAFMDNEKYYILATESNVDFELSIDLDYLEVTNGIFSLEGFKYIKYTPIRTSVYKLQGINSYSWYNSQYQQCNAYLTAGKTYYLKIEGEPLTAFDIDIVMNRNQLAIGRVNNVYEGYYYFNIQQAGTYSFRTYCTNNVSSKVSIYDFEGKPLKMSGQVSENLNVDKNAYEISLSKGLYYIDLSVINPDRIRVGIHITKIN